MRKLVLIIHDVRSCLNVGAMLRTAEGLGVNEVILSGYTPFPKISSDPRLPHLAAKIDKQIKKTSLGAETTLAWRHEPDLEPALASLKARGFTVAALEQTSSSTSLPVYRPPDQLAIIVGNEVTGVAHEVLRLCDLNLAIPMAGRKESFNVASAAAMALFYCLLVE